MNLPWSYTNMFIWAILEITSLMSQSCPKYCSCRRRTVHMACDGKGVLNYIPKLPDYVATFHLTDTNLGRLTRAKAKNLTSGHLTNLYLVNNNITSIAPDAMNDIENLNNVDWTQRNFPVTEFVVTIQHLQNLTAIKIRANIIDTEIVLASHFQHLIHLKSLLLHLKIMKTFNTTGLAQMKHLSTLDLGDNQLVDFSLDIELPSLEQLKLYKNNLGNIPSLCSANETSLTPQLSILNLEDNVIRMLKLSKVSCLRYLRKLVLTENRIEYLEDNAFANLPAIRELHLSKMTYLQEIGDLAFNSSSLTELLFLQNPSMSRVKANPETIFSHTPNLTYLDMSNTELRLDIDDLKALLMPLKNIKHLRLQNSRIMNLPVGLFSHLTKLTNLILSSNSLWDWDNSVFANVTSIKRILLDKNKIKVINEHSFPIEFRLSVKEIDLANNLFNCSCDLLWFRSWMKEVIANKSITFSQYPQKYTCRTPQYGLALSDFNPTTESCTIHQGYFVILVISLSVCIFFTVTLLVGYRYRWYILYWISLMRRRRQRRCQDPPAEMRYDGFISYSNPDWDWVSAELMDFLEDEVGLRLCEHSRDFKPGMYIVDNVIDAMETSRKTILVISNEYMQSDWCQFELQMALSSYLKKEIDIVVILLEQVQSRHVSLSLRALMVSTTYIEWADDPEAKRLFRERIQNALRE